MQKFDFQWLRALHRSFTKCAHKKLINNTNLPVGGKQHFLNIVAYRFLITLKNCKDNSDEKFYIIVIIIHSSNKYLYTYLTTSKHTF